MAKKSKSKNSSTHSRNSKNQSGAKIEKSFLIVGVGASAGGLPAISEVLSHLPQEAGLALVFIQHMDPSHVSQLPTLLSRVSRMPVLEVVDGLRVEKNHVYLIPPHADLQISEGVLKLTNPQPRAKPPFHLPIDIFFKSLAKDQKERAVGVILSGTGRDGSEGLAAIKSEGGMAFVQDEKSAQYPDMPKAAMDITEVDGVLPGDAIANELLRLAASPLRKPSKTQKMKNFASEPFSKKEDQHLATIFDVLKEATGTDFSRYKPTTIQRRLMRRMVANKATSLTDYIAVLRKNKEEVTALHREMLINVTGFFRDPEVFDLLKEKVIPEILKAAIAKSSLRIWVPACSTGEEVYSLAITFLESLSGEDLQIPIQIFGSDISEPVLEKARSGIYTEDEMAGVSPERRKRFFVKANGGYQIVKTIRDLCVFAKQDLTRNPPFSKMDLISCRNLLIYLSLNLQNKVFSIFHYALNPQGFLMLGTAETIGSLTDLFAVIDKRGKIYSRKSVPHKLPFDVMGTTQWGKQDNKPTPPPLWDKFDLEKETNRMMIEKFAPPGVVVNEDMTILRFQGQMRPYLDPTAGGASLNLMKMVLEGLVTDLRILMDEAAKENRPVKKNGIPILQNGKATRIDLEIIPLPHPGTKERYFTVLFHEEKSEPSKKAGKSDQKNKKSFDASSGQNQRLRTELEVTKRQLQSIIETEEATNQELRAANEEILSSNEELQSTNEELETAKEELQSTNEELSTVNDELRNRNLQLIDANADLSNIFISANLPIIMLQSDLRIRHFTPMAEKVMNLKPGDEGRLISDFMPNIDIPNLEDVILECMRSGKLQEEEVKDKEGTWHLLQIRPYRTAENKIAGAVIALVNVHALRTALEELTDARDFSETILQTTLNPIIVLDSDRRVIRANESFYKVFQTSSENIIGSSFYDIGNRTVWNIPELKTLLEARPLIDFANFEVDRVFPGIGRKVILLNARSVLLKEKEEVIVLSMQDITKQKENSLDLTLQYEIVKALAASSNIVAAADSILQAICRRFDWQAGQLWVVESDQEADYLAPAAFWNSTPKSCSPLEIDGFLKRYKLQKKAADWSGPKDGISGIMQLGKEFQEERSQLASKCNFQIPFVFSIWHRNKILGALEFFSDRPLKNEKELAQLAENLGSQMGQFIENKAAEKLKQETEEIFRLSKQRLRFAAMTSHELRAPLSSIKEGIGLVLDELSGPLNKEQKENLRISQNNVNRLTNIINNLLDLNRIDSDSFRISFAPAKIKPLVKETCDSMKPVADLKGVSLSYELPQEGVQAVCDAEMIRQVVVNLIDNAIKFTDKGGKIMTRLEEGKKQIFIHVSDTGTGIQKEDQERIFDLYEQSDPKKKSTGFGIGLAVCKKIMEQHQGNITVQSVFGKGSEFTLSLPKDLTPSNRKSN